MKVWQQRQLILSNKWLCCCSQSRNILVQRFRGEAAQCTNNTKVNFWKYKKKKNSPYLQTEITYPRDGGNILVIYTPLIYFCKQFAYRQSLLFTFAWRSFVPQHAMCGTELLQTIFFSSAWLYLNIWEMNDSLSSFAPIREKLCISALVELH